MKTIEILRKYGFFEGRLISGSKTGYKNRYPDHLVIFNANIITDEGKVGWGDIDVDVDDEKLKKVAKETNQDLYILYEMDARFDNENKPIEDLKSRAIVTITKDGELKINKK